MHVTLGALTLPVSQPGGAASEDIGTGAMVWQAGPAVAQAVVACTGGMLVEQLRGGRVIELGCGCSALPAVAMALAGAAEVLATDSAAVVAELQSNLAAYCDVDEAATSPSGRSQLRQTIVSESLVWDDPAALGALARDEHGRSVVLAADCDYAETLHDMLLDAVCAALSPTTSSVALFATAARCQRTLRLFLARVGERGFDTLELSEGLDAVLPSELAGKAQARDGVRYFAARWRSADDAKLARDRFVAAAETVAT